MTITTLIKGITRRWCKSGVIDESDVDVYKYGLDLLLFTILNITAVLVSAALIGKLIESLILLAVILPLQSFGGGYHAKTHLRCFLIMYIGWWGVILLLPFINSYVASAVTCFSVVIVFITAPVPHVNVKMSVKHRLTLRRLARVAVLAIAGLSIILIIFTPNDFVAGICISTGLSVAAFSMLLAHCKNGFQRV